MSPTLWRTKHSVPWEEAAKNPYYHIRRNFLYSFFIQMFIFIHHRVVFFWNKVLYVALSLPIATVKDVLTPRLCVVRLQYLLGDKSPTFPLLSFQKYGNIVQTSCHQGDRRGICNSDTLHLQFPVWLQDGGAASALTPANYAHTALCEGIFLLAPQGVLRGYCIWQESFLQPRSACFCYVWSLACSCWNSPYLPVGCNQRKNRMS